MAKSERKNIGEFPHAQGKWAVFRKSIDSRRVNFACLHDTKESAAEEARRLAADHIATRGVGEFRYYICEVGGFCGIHENKPVDTL